jgi:hypothetical protein
MVEGGLQFTERRSQMLTAPITFAAKLIQIEL